jgi:hypothetical protein
MTDPSPIDWDAEVVLFTNDDPPLLSVSRATMTLREAVEAVLEMPREKWTKAGIGLHKPVMMMVQGRPSAQGYLSGYAARHLAGVFDVPSADTSPTG